MENGRFAFVSPSPFAGLEATYDDHLWLIGKHVVDFLLWTFSLGVTAEALATSEYRFKIGDFAPTGASWPKISGRRCCPPTNRSSSHKTRLNDFLYGIKICTELSSVLSQSTRLTDGRTDGQTDSFLLTRLPCIQCSAVIIWRYQKTSDWTTSAGPYFCLFGRRRVW